MKKDREKAIAALLKPELAYRVIDQYNKRERDIKRTEDNIYSAREVVAGKAGEWKTVDVVNMKYYIDASPYLTPSESQARTLFDTFTIGLEDWVTIKVFMVIKVALRDDTLSVYEGSNTSVLLRFKDDSQMLFDANKNPRFQVVG